MTDSLYKIRHKESGLFIKTSIEWFHIGWLVRDGRVREVCSKQGRVYSNKEVALKLLNYIQANLPGAFELVELKTEE